MAELNEIDIKVREYWFELKTIWNAYVVSDGNVDWYLDDEVDSYFKQRVYGFWQRANAGTLKYFNEQVKDKFPEEIQLPTATDCWSYTLTNMMHREETAVDRSKVKISNVIDAIFIKGIERARKKFGAQVSFSKAMGFVMNSFDTKVVELGFEHYIKQFLVDANAEDRKKIRSGDALVGGENSKQTLFDLLAMTLLEEFSEVEQREFLNMGETIGREYAKELIETPSRMVGLVLYMSKVSVLNDQIAPLVKAVVEVPAGTMTDHWKKDREALGHLTLKKYGADLENDREARNCVSAIAMDVAYEIGKTWFFSEKRYEDLFSLVER